MENISDGSIVNNKLSLNEYNEKLNFENVDNKRFDFGIKTVVLSSKLGCFSSSEEEIPSFQVAGKLKRSSDKSEKQEPILPISPVATSPSVKQSENRIASASYMLGTIAERKESIKFSADEVLDELCTDKLSVECSCAYDKLDIMDKDISWNSSMEIPASQVSTSNQFNTIERVILLPENDSSNVQPRILFSPNKSDDCSFKILRYSSDSDCEESVKEGKKKTNDICDVTHTSLMESQNPDVLLEVNLDCEKAEYKTQDLFFENDSKESRSAILPLSPIFRIEKTKKKSKRKKMKSAFVKSPPFDVSVYDTTVQRNCDTSCIEDKTIVDCGSDLSLKSNITKTGVNTSKSEVKCSYEQSNSIQDDSFQNMSFSCIDELVKNSVNVTSTTLSKVGNQTSILIGQNSLEGLPMEEISEKNVTVLNQKINQNKYFYSTTNNDDLLHQAPTLDNFLKCAKKFEEGNIVLDKVLEDSFTNTELVAFSDMMNDCSEKKKFQELKTNKSAEISLAVKIQKPCNTGESELEGLSCIAENEGSNMNNFNDGSQPIDSVQPKISSHSHGNNGLLGKFPTSANNNELNKAENSFGILNRELKNADNFKHASVEQGNQCKIQDSHSVTFPIISTALGKPISISVQAYNKAKNIFGNEFEDDDILGRKHFDGIPNNESHKFQGFRTANNTPVTISEESLNKVKILFKEFDEIDCEKASDVVISRAFDDKAPRKFIKHKKTIVAKVDNVVGKNESEEAGFDYNMLSFKTSSDKRIKISKEALNKVKTLWLGEEDIDEKSFESFDHKKLVNQEISEDVENHDIMKVNGSETNFSGFSTASGKRVTVSEIALRKAKEILRENVQEDELRKDEPSCFEEKSGNVQKRKESDLQEKNKGLEEKDSAVVGDISVDNSEDEAEIIPLWLHAYKTSPAMTDDRMNLSVLTSHGDRIYHSTPNEQYLVKSPVLATTDRFFNRKRRKKQGRKLDFEASPKHFKSEEKSNFFVPHKIMVKNQSGKRCPTEVKLDFAAPFKKLKLDNSEAETSPFDGVKLTEEVIRGREKCRMEQAQSSKKGKVKPVMGSHLLKKREPQVKWSEMVGDSLPGTYTEEELRNHGVRNDVMGITSSNAADYKFRSLDFYTFNDCCSNTGGFAVGDGCSLIFENDNTAGVAQISRAFFASPGVESNLISEEWVRNHYKWIVWKLSRYERAFPHIFGGKCLTPHNLLLQLKYRYDREIDRSDRSALKKIFEHDDSPSRRMVLCVFDIKPISDLENKSIDSAGNKSVNALYKLGLTDGWYSCYAETDSAMTKLIENRRVDVGTKLIMQGAKLLNCDKGISPLDISENVHLRISTNSTRRVKWDTKLGFQKNNGPILVSLNSLLPQGGYVGRIDVIIVRVYPILYMEKKSDGSHVIRNRRAEDKAAALFQQKQDEMVEKIYQQVKDEIQKKAIVREKIDKKLSISDLPNICDPEDLYRLYESCLDPSTFQSHLTTEQMNNLIDYQRWKNESIKKELSETMREKINKEKLNDRNITQFLRIKIIDLHKPDYKNVILFTAWNCTEDVLDVLDEGKALSIFNVTATNSRSSGSIQLNSTRQTFYKKLSKVSRYPGRKLTLLKDLTHDYEPLFNEIDLVGIVVFIHEMIYGSKQAQTLFLTDLDKNFAGVIFWGNYKNNGWDNILTINTVVACINLQWNKKNVGGVPCVYANDSTIFTENPKHPHLREEVKNLKISLPRDLRNFICKCEEDIKTLLDEQKNASKNSSNHNDSDPGGSVSLKPKYTNGFKMKPNASSTPFKSFGLIQSSGDQEPSPIQKRIEKLKMYGEPPPLPNLLPLDNLEKFRTKFKVPFKNVSGSDSIGK